jgi:hypothetical protein
MCHRHTPRAPGGRKEGRAGQCVWASNMNVRRVIALQHLREEGKQGGHVVTWQAPTNNSIVQQNNTPSPPGLAAVSAPLLLSGAIAARGMYADVRLKHQICHTTSHVT